MVNKEKIGERRIFQQLTASELAMLKSVNHHRILNFHSVLQDSKNYFIVTELLMGG